MSAHDSLDGLAADLRALPARERRAIMKALSGFERTKAAAMLRQQRRAVRATPKLADVEVSPFSPWLADLIAEAQGTPAQGAARALTPATRKLLCEFGEAATPRLVPAAKAEAGRSLVGAIAALLFAGGLA